MSQAITLIYKNTYKQGQTYTPGNTVTWGGSLWHCDVETSERPGVGADWTMCVKKGRDGREVQFGQIQKMVDDAVAIAISKLNPGAGEKA